MNSYEIRQKFLDFFAKRGHAVIPSSSLIPDDPSVLLTTAGMQQFKKYYTGEADAVKDFGSLNTASCQKSFRTSDIDGVGDESHLTFFEMLGNFSFGGYFKKEAVEYAYDFITKEVGLEISYVTVFKGSDVVPKDEESRSVWNSLGVRDVREQGMEDVFWGPTGSSGPCGPTTEIYCKNAEGKDVEIWNIVFNEFFCSGSREELLKGNAKLEPLKTNGIDTGMGFERLVMAVQKRKNIFETDLFYRLMGLLPELVPLRQKRIIADHVRGSVFLLADGVRPSNKGAGYILRRLLRRVFVYEYQANLPGNIIDDFIDNVVREYGSFYMELINGNQKITEGFKDEKKRFGRVLKSGMNIFENYYRVGITKIGQPVSGTEFEKRMHGSTAFELYTTYGFPRELIEEIAKERGIEVDWVGFDDKFKKHQEISRAGLEKKFGGHGLILDTGELKAANEEELIRVIRLHTATHLMQAAIRKILGPEVKQDGSDITVERTRFDFTFSRKLTTEERQKIEDLVNEAVSKDFQVKREEMDYEEAVKSGALRFFREKYPKRVSVYTVYDSKTGEVFSKELCGGPHVSHTGEIGTFKITKEESSSAGVRRIRATVE